MATDTNLVGDDKIGGFRFVRTIHPGATTAVMEVIQESTKRRFALKQLQAAGVEAAERKAFAFEAKLGMQLFHPNLIRVHEYFRDPYQPYFVMDLFPSIHLKLPIARPSVYPMPIDAAPPDHRAGGQRPCSTCTRRAGFIATSSPRTSW